MNDNFTPMIEKLQNNCSQKENENENQLLAQLLKTGGCVALTTLTKMSPSAHKSTDPAGTRWLDLANPTCFKELEISDNL